MELITEEKINNIKRNAERYYHIGNDVVSEGIFERFWPLAPFASEKYFDTSRHKNYCWSEKVITWMKASTKIKNIVFAPIHQIITMANLE